MCLMCGFPQHVLVAPQHACLFYWIIVFIRLYQRLTPSTLLDMQAEFMDADLLAFGIDLTHELDRRFGLEPKISMSQVRRNVASPQMSAATALCSAAPLTASARLPRAGLQLTPHRAAYGALTFAWKYLAHAMLNALVTSVCTKLTLPDTPLQDSEARGRCRIRGAASM